MVSDINVEFDKEGKIKENYKVKGFIKNAKIGLLKKYDLDGINLIFNLVFRPDQFVIEKWLQLKGMTKISDRLLYLNL